MGYRVRWVIEIVGSSGYWVIRSFGYRFIKLSGYHVACCWIHEKGLLSRRLEVLSPRSRFRRFLGPAEDRVVVSVGFPITALIGLTGHRFPTIVHLKPLAPPWFIRTLGYWIRWVRWVIGCAGSLLCGDVQNPRRRAITRRMADEKLLKVSVRGFQGPGLVIGVNRLQDLRDVGLAWPAASFPDSRQPAMRSRYCLFARVAAVEELIYELSRD